MDYFPNVIKNSAKKTQLQRRFSKLSIPDVAFHSRDRELEMHNFMYT